ncbi:glycosyltransferase family 2 protein [Paenibacillus ginsengarvi]|uniref:Glucosyl-3-phosphoglycerate synthase n=1 Tax=Paenibacillus ginsengarvi TaxID=400777 RepID=A0A3B0CK66_9BACL|nr:glycosyltransferase family 2 protein [Paenibacillus ginsengarvi]RKN84679.1 glycosyltransferase family 2 protein [Paenibacillus ginsengarvi]
MADESVSIVVPAWNEENTIGATLEALHRIRGKTSHPLWSELIVVDDGSTDLTAERASRWATVVIEHERRLGKGAAMRSGWMRAKGDIVLFADADLEHSAEHLAGLLEPVRRGEADMAVARFEQPSARGGFGLAKRFAGNGIYRMTGLRFEAPLSGQRAVRSELLRKMRHVPVGFGIEVGLTIDAARLGYRICEVPLPLCHREMGKSLSGFWHRGGQMVAIAQTMLRRWSRSAP